MLSTISPVKAALATSATAALILAGAFSAAAAGALPGAAQDTAHEVLAKIGVTVPGPNEASGVIPTAAARPARTTRRRRRPPRTPPRHGDRRGHTDTTETDEGSAGKGSEISELAKNTESTGVDKGAEISTQASGGNSQAGQHGAPTDTPTGQAHRPGQADRRGQAHRPGQADRRGQAHRPGAPDEQAPSATLRRAATEPRRGSPSPGWLAPFVCRPAVTPWVPWSHPSPSRLSPTGVWARTCNSSSPPNYCPAPLDGVP